MYNSTNPSPAHAFSNYPSLETPTQLIQRKTPTVWRIPFSEDDDDDDDALRSEFQRAEGHAAEKQKYLDGSVIRAAKRYGVEFRKSVYDR